MPQVIAADPLGSAGAVTPAAAPGGLGAQILAYLTALAAFAFAGLRLESWLLSGGEGAALSLWSPGPLMVLALSVLALAGPLALRCGPFVWAASGLLVAAYAAMAAETPARALNAHFGAGPMQIWCLAPACALVLAFLWWQGRRGQGRSALLWLLVFLSCANGKLFARESPALYQLLLGGALTAAAASPWPKLPRGILRWTVCCALALLLTIAIAAALGDSSSRGWRITARIFLGLLLAYAVAGQWREQAPRRLLQASLAGLALALALQFAGLYEAALDEGWLRVWKSRWRLFDMHPNGSAPLFGWGLALALGPALLGPGLVRRLLGLVLALGSALVLWRSQSAAAAGGALVAVMALVILLGGFVPRRGRSLPLFALGSLAAALALWVSPLGTRLTMHLEALTAGPSALGQRYYLWRLASKASAEAPWFGQGPNQYYLHARFAEPSYYDSTPQDLHPHNLAFALAEGAGLPALALFGLLCLLTLELGRRQIRASSGARARLYPAALLAAWLAVLAANTLDLGQSQQTLIPLWCWLLLGALLGPLLGQVGAAAGAPVRIWIRRGLGLLLTLLWPLLAGLSLAGELLLQRGLALSETGQNANALSQARWAQRLTPDEPGPLLLELQVARRTRGANEVLRVARRAAALTPKRASSQLALAEAALQAGQVEPARVALERAQAADPLGPDQAQLSSLRVALLLRQGQRAKAEEELLHCLRIQGAPWAQLERRQTAGRIELFTPAAPQLGLDLTAALQTLAAECIAQTATDPVLARRAARGISDAYVALGQLETAADFLVTQRAASAAPFPSLVGLEMKLRIELEQKEKSLALLELLEGLDDGQARRMRIELAGKFGDPQLTRQVADELAQMGEVFAGVDLFFEHGELRPYLRWRLGLALTLEQPELAWLCYRRLLRDVVMAGQRRAEAEWGALRLAGSSAPAELAGRALALGLREFDWLVARQPEVAALASWKKRLGALPAERRAALRAALASAGQGPAARALLAAW